MKHAIKKIIASLSLGQAGEDNTFQKIRRLLEIQEDVSFSVTLQGLRIAYSKFKIKYLTSKNINLMYLILKKLILIYFQQKNGRIKL